MKTLTVSLVAGLLLLFVAAAASYANTATFGTGASQFGVEFVEIGDPGNPPDTTGEPNPAGSVGYVYSIGKHEISQRMIEKATASGLTGVATSGWTGDKPATRFTWFEAAKFVNWLNTTKGFSPAYKFDGGGNFQLWQAGDAGFDPGNPYRNILANYFLPSVDEWYKAAYYDPVNELYYNYPTGSNAAPTAVASGTAPGTAVYSHSGPADITQAGGLSPYGTMGQGGNVWEWEETAFDLGNDSTGEARGIRGGGSSGIVHLRSSERESKSVVGGDTTEGVRVAALFSPDSDSDGLTDHAETNFYGTDPIDSDSDDDGLSDGQEVSTYGTNPLLADTDADGFNDKAEIEAGKDPLDINDTPDAVVNIYKAAEFEFFSQVGESYQVQWSEDLETWTTFPEVIAGTGDAIIRFYSTRYEPKRYFRAEKVGGP